MPQTVEKINARRTHRTHDDYNERRPLTVNMIHFLRTLHSYSLNHGAGRHNLFPREMTQAEKNAAKALLGRGLVGWDNGMLCYYLNHAGRAALGRG